jgi:hypothetical protein
MATLEEIRKKLKENPKSFDKVYPADSWIHSHQALLMTIKYDYETIEEYQKYLDNDIWSVIDREEGEDPLPFDEWIVLFLEEVEWQSSDQFANLIKSLKD